jgi:hypothetical protein
MAYHNAGYKSKNAPKKKMPHENLVKCCPKMKAEKLIKSGQKMKHENLVK